MDKEKLFKAVQNTQKELHKLMKKKSGEPYSIWITRSSDDKSCTYYHSEKDIALLTDWQFSIFEA